MDLIALSKLAESVTRAEELHYEKGYLGPGVPGKSRTELPIVDEPQTWEFSAHPHQADIAGLHIDMRLGDPKTGIAHSFVVPKRDKLPGPGESLRVIPTWDHEIPYMDYTGPISTVYGRGVVSKGRRERADVYHAKKDAGEGTKLRFNLYDGDFPEEFSVRKDRRGHWFLHNKTQTRERRPDIPAAKPAYREIDLSRVDPTDTTQVLMPKLDGAHAIIDLKAGRAPRVYSYRVGKLAATGLIEHTHKIPELLKTKVPKELDGTILRAEAVGFKDGNPVPAEQTAGLLNAKVWKSREEQERTGARLKAFPFSVVRHRGKDMEQAPFSEKVKVLDEVQRLLPDLEHPAMVYDAEAKLVVMNMIKDKSHPMTDEGIVLVDKDSYAQPVKAKVAPDFDVHVRDVLPAKKKGGGFHDRAGAVSYSWTQDGPVVGQVGGFKHDEARDMLANPDKYVGRVAKVRARKVFKKGDEMGAMFQPRFKEWHLDKGDIEKRAIFEGFFDELKKIAISTVDPEKSFAITPKPSRLAFSEEGVVYSVPKLWSLSKDLPTRRRSVAKLLPHLEKRMWKNYEGGETSALHTSSPYHLRKASKSDLRYPILLHPEGWIMDGAHRLLKAHRAGVKTVKVRKFTQDPTTAVVQGIEKAAFFDELAQIRSKSCL